MKRNTIGNKRRKQGIQVATKVNHSTIHVLKIRNSQRARHQAMALSLTQAEEHERMRIAQFLHDEVQPLVVAAKMNLVSLRRASKSKSFQKALLGINDLLVQTLTMSRELTSELSIAALHEGGLLAGLDWLVGWFGEKYGFTVKIKAAKPPVIPDRNLQTLLFRSVRELLFNAVKHGRTKAADVFVNQSKNNLQIVVSDQGIGFDPTHIGTSKLLVGGFGLRHLRERLNLLGGRLEIASAPGKGSRFTIVSPM